MKIFKKLFSIILSVCMIVTGVPNVSAFGGNDKENVNVLVMGSGESKAKFSRILFNKTESYSEYAISCDEKTNIKFVFPERGLDISGFIRSGYLVNTLKQKCKFNIILVAVDVDQNTDKVKSDIRSAVDYICDYKDNYTQIMIMGCTDRTDVTNTDDYLLSLANYVVSIERDCTPGKWGTQHNIDFDEQCLGFYPVSGCSQQSEILRTIARRSDEYEYLKKNRCIIV